MNRSEIRDAFRQENPEITDRVVSDTVLNTWILSADKEVAAATRCIVSNDVETISSVVDSQYYDLETNISKFFDIDDMPGGGVYYDGLPLVKKTAGEMNTISRSWRGNGSGIPRYYWRRGKYLWFEKPCSAVVDITLDVVYVSDDFDSDLKTPFNGLNHLEPFHDAIVAYLRVKGKQKLGKYGEAQNADEEYKKYLSWMKRQISGSSNSIISMRLPS